MFRHFCVAHLLKSFVSLVLYRHRLAEPQPDPLRESACGQPLLASYWGVLYFSSRNKCFWTLSRIKAFLALFFCRILRQSP